MSRHLSIPAFDRRSIEALDAVYLCNGFEAAADTLGVSQSAVSQRIKALQQAFSDPLLIRPQPYQLTPKGQALVDYLKTLRRLEGSLIQDLGLGSGLPELRIGLSRDMLEIWFLDLLTATNLMEQARLTLITTDQEETHTLLKRGEVNVALSPTSKPLGTVSPIFLGAMRYILVATPDFQNTYLSNVTLHPKALQDAPCLVYDRQDDLYQRYLSQFFKIDQLPPLCHTVPSVSGFKRIVLRGKALALIPDVDVQDELNTGALVQLFPEYVWEMPLYLHQSDFLRPSDQAILQVVVEHCQDYLHPKSVPSGTHGCWLY